MSLLKRGLALNVKSAKETKNERANYYSSFDLQNNAFIFAIPF